MLMLFYGQDSEDLKDGADLLPKPAGEGFLIFSSLIGVGRLASVVFLGLLRSSQVFANLHFRAREGSWQNAIPHICARGVKGGCVADREVVAAVWEARGWLLHR